MLFFCLNMRASLCPLLPVSFVVSNLFFIISGIVDQYYFFSVVALLVCDIFGFENLD